MQNHTDQGHGETHILYMELFFSPPSKKAYDVFWGHMIDMHSILFVPGIGGC